MTEKWYNEMNPSNPMAYTSKISNLLPIARAWLEKKLQLLPNSGKQKQLPSGIFGIPLQNCSGLSH